MAPTPVSDDAFLREVDDDLRRDRMTAFAQKWGRLIVAAILIGLALLAAFLWWQSHRAKQAGADGEALSGALTDLEQGRTAQADAALAKLTESPRDGYRATARLTQAAALVARNDLPGAQKAYEAIAADTDLPQAVRDLATLRGVAVGFDTMAPQAVVDQLKPLAVPGNPWFGSAGELTAAAYLKLNRPAQSGPLLAAIARDPQVPGSLRGRVAGLATALGQTVEPIAPAAIKE